MQIQRTWYTTFFDFAFDLPQIRTAQACVIRTSNLPFPPPSLSSESFPRGRIRSYLTRVLPYPPGSKLDTVHCTGRLSVQTSFTSPTSRGDSNITSVSRGQFHSDISFDPHGLCGLDAHRTDNRVGQKSCAASYRSRFIIHGDNDILICVFWVFCFSNPAYSRVHPFEEES